MHSVGADRAGSRISTESSYARLRRSRSFTNGRTAQANATVPTRCRACRRVTALCKLCQCPGGDGRSRTLRFAFECSSGHPSACMKKTITLAEPRLLSLQNEHLIHISSQRPAGSKRVGRESVARERKARKGE